MRGSSEAGGGVEDVWREEGEIHKVVPARRWEEILEEVAGQRELGPREILGTSKTKKVSLARREFLVRAHAEARMSVANVGRICNMAHSSVRETLAKGLPERGSRRGNRPTVLRPPGTPRYPNRPTSPRYPFWTNGTTKFLASASEVDRQTRIRNRCNRAGYESVALIPLRAGNGALGLLQLNDRREGRFTPGMITLWERLAGFLVMALAKFEADEGLRASEARYRAVFRSSLVAIGVTELESGRFVDVNEAFCTLLGYSREEVIGRNAFELDIWATPEKRAAFHEQLLKEGRAAAFEHRARRKSGEIRTLTLSAEVVWLGGEAHAITVGSDNTERTQAEEALRESEERLRLAAKAAGFGFYDFDFSTGQAFYSPEFLALYGLPAEARLELDEDLAPRALHPGDKARFLACMRAGNDPRGDGVLDLEYRIFRSDGELRWLRVRGQTSFSGRQPTDRPLRANGIVQDFTDRKRAEDELELFFDLVPDMVCIASTDGYFKKINKAWGRVLGYVEEELLATPFLDLVHPDDRSATLAEVEKQVCGESTTWFVNRYRGNDGSYRWLEWLATPAVENKLLFAAARDITERKLAEEALRKSQQLLAETEKVGKVGGWELDVDTGRQRWTEEVYDIHEVEHTFEPNVENGVGFYTPASRPVIERAVQRAVEHGEPFDLELEIVTAKGNLRSVHAIGRADPENHRVYGFFQDITERKAAERETARLLEQTRRDDEAKGRLVREINHRVKNNLVSLLGLLLAEKRGLSSAVSPGVAAIVDRVSDRIRGMLKAHEMLSDAEWAPLTLTELATHVVRQVLGHAIAAGRCSLEVSPSEAQVSPRQVSSLALVLNELATNTLKYAAARQERVAVAVRIEEQDELCTIHYRDDGPGYPASVLGGELPSVGLGLVSGLVCGTLRGSFALSNEGGAVTTIRIRKEDPATT